MLVDLWRCVFLLSVNLSRMLNSLKVVFRLVALFSKSLCLSLTL